MFLPKSNIEAEQSVLGAVLIDNKGMRIASELLTAEDFYKEAHRKIFAGMIELNEKSEPIDIVTLTDHLKKKNDLDAIGGPHYLTTLAMTIPTAANIRYHGRIVAETGRMRGIQQLCLQILGDISGGVLESSDTAIAQVHAAIATIISNQGDTIVDMRDVAKETFDYVERRHKHRGIISGIPSGFKDFDGITDGFQPSDLIILAARPSMGKTALAISFAQNAAEAGYPVGVISLEMGKQALGIRMLASLSGVDLLRLRKGLLDRNAFDALVEATARMASLPIYLEFSAWDIEQIRKVITQMVELKGVKMIFVDYLQLAKNSKQKVREREVGEISTTLKHMAKMFQIPVIVLSQLSRKVEDREDKRPKLSDLRDSGQIEQDADIIIFLYREKPTEHKGITEVIFSKGRQTGLGSAKLYFDGDRMQFKDYPEI